MAEPMLRDLQSRGEVLTVAALPWVAPVFMAMPQVAEVLVLPFAHGQLEWSMRRHWARQLAGRFDAAYILPNSFKSALLPFLAGIPRRIGYLGEFRLGLLNQRLPNPPRHERPPMVAHYRALAAPNPDMLPALGLPGSDHVPKLHVGAGHSAAVLSAYGVEPGRYVALVPGAEFGSAKRWPTAHFAQVVASLLQGSPLSVVVLGSEKDTPWASEIEHAVRQTLIRAGRPSDSERLHDLTGVTSLADAMAWIAAARGVLCNDTGLMHVAAALDVPLLALFGSSNPAHTPPLSEQAQVLWLKHDPTYSPSLDCAPCHARVCPLGHMRCLNDLGPDRVLAALGPLIGLPAKPATAPAGPTAQLI
jgi:heptosyltransferase-2